MCSSGFGIELLDLTLLVQNFPGHQMGMVMLVITSQYVAEGKAQTLGGFK